MSLLLAPRFLRVATSSFLSIISIDSEPTMLKHATARMNVRKMKAMNFSIFIILNVSSCCSILSSTLYFSPAMFRIFAFTLSISLPGLILISSCDNMPCCPNKLRAKDIEVSI